MLLPHNSSITRATRPTSTDRRLPLGIMGVDHCGGGGGGGRVPTPTPTFQSGGGQQSKCPPSPTSLPKKRGTHLGSAIVLLSTIFLLSLLLFLVKNVQRSRGSARHPLDGVQHPQTPAVAHCMWQLYDDSLQWSPLPTFDHRSTPLLRIV